MQSKLLAQVVSALSLAGATAAMASDGVPVTDAQQNYIVTFERGTEQACAAYLKALNPLLVPVRIGYSHSIYFLSESQAAAVAQMWCVKLIEADQAVQPLW